MASPASSPGGSPKPNRPSVSFSDAGGQRLSTTSTGDELAGGSDAVDSGDETYVTNTAWARALRGGGVHNRNTTSPQLTHCACLHVYVCVCVLA